MSDLDEVRINPEFTVIHERLIVSPAKGRFFPSPPEIFTTEGEWVEEGQTVAEIQAGVEVQPVISAFTGWMMGMLVIPGQPVAVGDRLFRIRP
ncbi:MAG: hypothetical protein ACLGIB_08880 [Actinomycetota bacterium]